MKTLLKVDTWLPVFSGFYGTMWETDNDEEMELEYINDQRREKGLPDVSWDDVEWANDEYEKNVSESFTKWIGEFLKKEGYIHGYEFQNLSSPREYNFANDSIHGQFVLDDENVKAIAKYLKVNRERFTVYLKECYTSRDGFCSSYSNSVDVWMLDLEAVLSHQHQLGAVLNFICLNEDIEEMDIYEDLTGNGCTLYASNYDALIGGK